MIGNILRVAIISLLIILSACSNLHIRDSYKSFIPLEDNALEELNGIYALNHPVDSLQSNALRTLWSEVTDGSSEGLRSPDAIGISVHSSSEIQLILFKQKRVLDTYVLEGKISYGLFTSKTDRDYTHHGNTIFMYNADTFHIVLLPEGKVVIKHDNSFALLVLGIIPIGNSNAGGTYKLSRVSDLQ